MTLPCYSIAYADARSPRAEDVLAALRTLGHTVDFHDELKGCLAAPEPDVYVLGSTREGQQTGLELLAALRQRGRSAPIVLLIEQPEFDELRRAVELGANDVLFGAPTREALSRALARAGAQTSPAPRIDAEARARTLARRYPSEAATVGRAAREISAFLVNEGVAGAHRVRIASALAELVDNACRHAYPGAHGEVAVQVTLRGARVQLVVEDAGCGFDLAQQRLERVPPALPSRRGLRAVPAAGASAKSQNGLGRIERLCESSSIHSDAHGTRAELGFELTPVRFEEEPEHLSHTDFLDPERARSLIATLRQQSDLSNIAPDMALTVGRILGGLDAEVHHRPGA
jgi:anti-sigma regulatory factor (Ser/Thr protein kinase)